MVDREASSRDGQTPRQQRLAAELRANLKKRKAQARARSTTDEAAREAAVTEDDPAAR